MSFKGNNYVQWGKSHSRVETHEPNWKTEGKLRVKVESRVKYSEADQGEWPESVHLKLSGGAPEKLDSRTKMPRDLEKGNGLELSMATVHTSWGHCSHWTLCWAPKGSLVHRGKVRYTPWSGNGSSSGLNIL